MILTQVSAKVKNEPGQLSIISDALGDAGINIRALTASVHGKDAQIHMLTDDPGRTVEVLSARGFEVHDHKVAAVETPDHPGGLNAVLRPLKNAGINVDFLYPMIGRLSGNAVLVIGAEPIEDAVKALSGDYITVLDKEIEGL